VLHLKTVASPVSLGGVHYNDRTGIVQSNGKFGQTYGYFEARVYLPSSGGHIANWPAFWLDGQNWPANGELDVMEGLGGQAAYHFHSPSGGPGSAVSGNYTGWHIFGAEWQPGKVTYYYDNHLVGTITTGITNSPMYLILNNAIGSWGGPHMIPADMEVDWVHVYSASSSAKAVTAQPGYTGPGGTGTPVASGTNQPGVTIYVGAGNHLIDATHTVSGQPLPTNGNDSVIVMGPGNDTVHAGGGNDTLTGGPGNDVLYAGGGNDVLAGRSGSNVLVGATGHDRFVFNTALVPNAQGVAHNFSQVLHFDPVNDRIELSHAVFSKIASGVLSSAAFGTGPGPHDTAERIIYHPVSGYLTYDPDGSGPAHGVEFGKVAPNLHLTHSDFLIV
jgi:Ca2+-binding RTX toxin-like protein